MPDSSLHPGGPPNHALVQNNESLEDSFFQNPVPGVQIFYYLPEDEPVGPGGPHLFPEEILHNPRENLEIGPPPIGVIGHTQKVPDGVPEHLGIFQAGKYGLYQVEVGDGDVSQVVPDGLGEDVGPGQKLFCFFPGKFGPFSVCW